MIKVYFEMKYGRHSEMAAKFDSEETYYACLPALEELALKNGFDFISESITEEEL